MIKQSKLYEGKTKIIYKNNDHQITIWFKDDVTAFNNLKKTMIENKGFLSAQISLHLFTYLKKQNIPNHCISGSANILIAESLTMFPLEVVVRNVAAGSILNRLNFDKGYVFDKPIVELYYKNDQLKDPLINDEHCLLLKIITSQELIIIKTLAHQINNALTILFIQNHWTLVDLKLEFGVNHQGIIMVGDEIAPDTMRIWDEHNNSLDKDVFRESLDQTLTDVYHKVWQFVKTLM